MDEKETRRYRKLPVTISARRLTEQVTVDTLEGQMVGNPGDWLITGVAGEQYPVRDDIFRTTYELVE